MRIVKREALDMKLSVKAQENRADEGELGKASSMVDPIPPH